MKERGEVYIVAGEVSGERKPLPACCAELAAACPSPQVRRDDQVLRGVSSWPHSRSHSYRRRTLQKGVRGELTGGRVQISRDGGRRAPPGLPVSTEGETATGLAPDHRWWTTGGTPATGGDREKLGAVCGMRLHALAV